MLNELLYGKYERHASGAVVVDGKEVGHTLRCPHCGAHFVSVRGSGKKRGFCRDCSKVVCGATPCMSHVPLSAWLEQQEGAKDVAEILGGAKRSVL